MICCCCCDDCQMRMKMKGYNNEKKKRKEKWKPKYQFIEQKHNRRMYYVPAFAKISCISMFAR